MQGDTIMKRNGIHASWRLLLIGGLCGALILGVLAGPSDAAEKIKVGYIPIIYFVPTYIGIEEGYFAEHGLEVELIRFASGAKMNAPLATGELDVSTSAISSGLINAILQGQKFRVVADSGQVRPGYGSSSLIVRRDLIESGRVKSIKDLKGLKIARFAKGNIGDFMLAQVLRSGGLSLKDVTVVALPPPRIIGALKAKALDASTIAEPLATLSEVKKVAKKFVTMDKIAHGGILQIGTVIYSGQMRGKRSTAQKFMNAHLKGIQFYNKHGMKSPQVLAILTKYTKVPAKILKMATAFYLPAGGRPHTQSFQQFIDWAHEVGYTKQKLPLNDLVDFSFLK